MFNAAIDARTVGQYPLSIATSLAIESLNGIHPDLVVDKAPVLKVTNLWVNMRTLYRNFIGSLDKTVGASVDPESIAEALTREMDALTSVVSLESNGGANVHYYFSNYAGLEQKYKHAVVRRDNTEKQKEYTSVQNKTMAFMLKNHDDVVGFDLKIKPEQHQTAVILTHYAYDLLSAKNFSELVLLESHTGQFKHRAQWHTKYSDGQKLSMIPFREDFLQVFGDSQTFHPMDIRLRRDIIEVATKYNWSAVSTDAKIQYGIDQIKNPLAKDILRALRS